MRSLAGLAASPRPAPALDSLVHPVPLAALTLILLNDHVLKASYPGWLTGKLSDIAGLMLLPFVLLAGWELVRIARPGLRAAGPRLAVASVIVAVLAFTAGEVVPIGSDLYRLGMGGAQWPFRALAALVASEPLPGLAPVQLTSDLSDCPLRGMTRGSRSSRRRRSQSRSVFRSSPRSELGSATAARSNFDWFWPLALVGLGVVLLVSALARGR